MLRVKKLGISTGAVRVAVLAKKTAETLGLRAEDRLLLKSGEFSTIALLDIDATGKIVSGKQVGLFAETSSDLGKPRLVSYSLQSPPITLDLIKKKLSGKEFSRQDLFCIMKEISEKKLLDSEIAAYIAACAARGMSLRELIQQTFAMAAFGTKVSFKKSKLHPVIDIHCIGGAAGNRTSLVVVPLLVAAGYIVPKTCSRAITSPAGTADTFEVFCPVAFPVKKLISIVKNAKGCIVWGGGELHLAPADDIIIRLERQLLMNAEVQMVSSILAKKLTLGITHLFLDIPFGQGMKIASRRRAERLGALFKKVGKGVGITVDIFVSKVNGPVGKGIGPLLEAKDCWNILLQNGLGPKDLEERSLAFAGKILESLGKAKLGMGKSMAKEYILSGGALRSFKSLVTAQGGHFPPQLKEAAWKRTEKAVKNTVIFGIDNLATIRCAKVLGSPENKSAGIVLLVKKGDRVAKGASLYELHAETQAQLQGAIWHTKKNPLLRLV